MRAAHRYAHVLLTGGLLAVVLVGGCAGSRQAAPGLDTRLDLARTYSAQISGDALLVWIDGDLVLEDYPGDYDPTQPHVLTEISALLPSLVALKAAGEGRLALDAPVANALPEWTRDSLKAQITVGQLLGYTGGLRPGNLETPPTYEEAIEAPLVHEPGAGFRYGPTSIHAFGALMERALGSFGGLKEQILRPLGIPGGRWSAVGGPVDAPSARRLTPRLFDGARLTPRELLRVGRLLLQKGRWKGEQIIEDVGPLTHPAPASPGFGLGVWLNAEMPSAESSGPGPAFRRQVPERIMIPRGQQRLIYDGAPPDLYMAAGRFNQRLYVIPSREMVVVRLGRANRTWSDPAFLARLLDGRRPQVPATGETSGEGRGRAGGPRK